MCTYQRYKEACGIFCEKKLDWVDTMAGYTGLCEGCAEARSDEWIVSENGCVITCPECSQRLELCYPDGTEVRYLPYCPWCGKQLKNKRNF